MVPGRAIPSPRSGSGSAWVEHSAPPRPASGRAGCATGVMDRGQGLVVQYVGEEPIRVLGSVDYDVEGQVETRSWGGTTGLLDESFDYDIRNRPIAHEAVRAPTMGAMAGTIGAVEYVAREQFGWDVGSNLVEIRDTRPVEQWAEGHRPRNTYIGHDSLYRVAQVSYEYRDESGYGTDTSTDWRDDAAGPNADDPMQPRPASMIGQSHGERIQQLDYEWDYLGNQIRWLDDAFEAESRGEMFYERGIGEITNGNSTGASAGSLRPSALYLSTNIDTTGGVDPGWNGAGWVEVEYGISGNVASFTVHGQCHDNGALECSDSTGTLTSRIEHFRANCACAEEQHYRYRWDELNRLVEGLRYDRATGSDWAYGARMSYRYDGANQRTVKQSFAATDVNTPERYALYVYPGDFERRGLTLGFGQQGPTYLATTGTADATETQYLIAGARLVWDGEPDITGPGIDRNRRATVSASDLLGTTAASIDLESGALLEVSTYYPNGARENLWVDGADVPLEPMGFTGKEADEEIGVSYFGERWLIPRLGRWATPDPLHVHASGGGEALNSYHYVSGSLLQAVDPLGLNQAAIDPGPPDASSPPPPSEQERYQDGRNASQALRDLNDALLDLNSAVPWVDGGPDLTEVLRRIGLAVLFGVEQDADGQWRGSAEALRTHERRMVEDLAYERGYRDAESDFRRERAEQAARDADPLTPFAEIALEILVLGPVAEAGGAVVLESVLAETGSLALAEVELGSSIEAGRLAGVRGPEAAPRPISPPEPGQINWGYQGDRGFSTFEGHGRRLPGHFIVPDGVWLRIQPIPVWPKTQLKRPCAWAAFETASWTLDQVPERRDSSSCRAPT
jgi:RHS repeat-associated protein